MVSLLVLYALFNAACVSVLVVLAQGAPLVEDDPLPASLMVRPVPARPTNDNVQGAPEGVARPLRPMHGVA